MEDTVKMSKLPLLQSRSRSDISRGRVAPQAGSKFKESTHTEEGSVWFEARRLHPDVFLGGTQRYCGLGAR